MKGRSKKPSHDGAHGTGDTEGGVGLSAPGFEKSNGAIEKSGPEVVAAHGKYKRIRKENTDEIEIFRENI